MTQSKSNIFIIILVIIAIVGGAVYWFAFRNPAETPASSGTPGLVSTNAPAANTSISSSTNVSAAGSATGNQVVQILRNLSNIRLDDGVFRNPAFALLTDISITLPPVTIQGRRNPFSAPSANTETSASAVTTTPVGAATSSPVL
jgi:hypothetical protein